MSKVGRQPVAIPENVNVIVSASRVTVKGPKGELELRTRPEIMVEKQDQELVVKVRKENKFTRSLHGLTRTLLANMFHGVTHGFEKRLELVGTGYRVAKQGDSLRFSLGFSHEVDFKPPADIELVVEGQNKVIISGTDKQAVGQVAANIRALRPPEPYKGKGIRYEDEVVRRKVGKQAKVVE